MSCEPNGRVPLLDGCVGAACPSLTTHLENSYVTSRLPPMLRDPDFSLKPSVIELALANRSRKLLSAPRLSSTKLPMDASPMATSNHSIRFALKSPERREAVTLCGASLSSDVA